MLWNADDLGMSLRYEASAAAARSIAVTVQPLAVREPNDFAKTFEMMDREPPDAITIRSARCIARCVGLSFREAYLKPRRARRPIFNASARPCAALAAGARLTLSALLRLPAAAAALAAVAPAITFANFAAPLLVNAGASQPLAI